MCVDVFVLFGWLCDILFDFFLSGLISFGYRFLLIHLMVSINYNNNNNEPNDEIDRQNTSFPFCSCNVTKYWVFDDIAAAFAVNVNTIAYNL